MTRGIEHLSDHVIICGFGRIGEVLTSDLKHSHREFVVIDSSTERFEIAKSLVRTSPIRPKPQTITFVDWSRR